MELKKGPLSIPLIIGCGLKAANQAFGAVIVLFIIVFLINLFAGFISALAMWIFHKYAIFLQIPLVLVSALIGIMLPLALIKIIASKIEKTGLTAWESLMSSALQAIYFFLSSLILAIPAMLILVGAMLSRSALVVLVAYILLGLAMFPFMFVQHAIALRDEGPVSSLVYSWKLTTAHFGRVFLSIFTILLLFIVGILAIICLIKVFLPQLFINPAMLQIQLMMLPKIYVFLGGIVAMALYAFILLSIQAIFTVLFLNLDYCHRQVKTREHDTPRVKATVGIVDSVVQEPEVKVKYASVASEATEDTIQHLEKVYNPQEHVPQILEQEEDRMPTILFDEDMAKQLAEHEQNLQEKKQASNNPDDMDPPSIKISDKSL